MAVRILIDESRCCGAGACVLAAPQVFDQRDDDGVVILLNESPPAELLPGVRKAAQLCPGLAIRLHDDDEQAT